jgi:hypothetical protein
MKKRMTWDSKKPNIPGFYVCNDQFGLPYTVEVRKVGRGMTVAPVYGESAVEAEGPMRSIPEDVSWLGPLPA